jgi:hypothetical protein
MRRWAGERGDAALTAQPIESPDRMAYDGAIADMAGGPSIELPDV